MRLHRCFYTVTCCSYLRCPKTIPCANPGMLGVVGPVRAQPTVHRRRRHRDQQRRRRTGNDQLLEAPQPRHQLRHDRGEALARRGNQHRSAKRQRHHRRPIPRRPRGAGPDELRRQRRLQRLTGVVAVPPRGCGATPWWRTTHRGSCPSPPCSRARTASRSFWSPHVAGPSSVPIHQGLPAPTQPPLQARPYARTPA